MSDRVQRTRPRIYDNDAFAADIAGAIFGAATGLWQDAETFLDQLFAASAGEEGYPYWAEALGIPLTFAQVQARRDGICRWLLRGGAFNRDYVSKLIRRHTGTSDFTIEESVNWIDIYLPPSVSALARYDLATALAAERPMHVGFALLTQQSLNQ